MLAKFQKIVVFGTLIALGSCAPRWHGFVFVDRPSDAGAQVKSKAYAALDQLVSCGYKPPEEILIQVRDLNPDGAKNHMVWCGYGYVGGSVIQLDKRDDWFGEHKQCERYEDTIAHEVLHLMKYRHETPSQRQDFARRMIACGFFPIGT